MTSNTAAVGTIHVTVLRLLYFVLLYLDNGYTHSRLLNLFRLSPRIVARSGTIRCTNVGPRYQHRRTAQNKCHKGRIGVCVHLGCAMIIMKVRFPGLIMTRSRILSHRMQGRYDTTVRRNQH